ncbi:MAG TPA: lysylphosphatidylglycerol synthase transmembrane domain-containing protein [Polyangia bacterium]|nr:lysylphosphatidylglycerol synthase transmembrane domain-containing protein [Polyangia bacterium]
MSRKLVVQGILSLVVGAVCVVYAVHGMDGHAVLHVLGSLGAKSVALYLLTLLVTHLFRTLRWEYLLRALGTSLPFRRLLPISSVGFMAILALPVRLGEFVRPYLVSRERNVRMSTMVGAVAVERIVDGLMISILFFVAYLASAGDLFTRELRAAAWLSLGGFVGLTLFLVLAQIWTDRTIALALRLTLLTWLAPSRAQQAGEKLRALISGFRALADRKNFSIFLIQSVVYWASNGVGMWILARQMHLPISLGAAFVIMAFTGVVLSLPNSPGLVGQFHAAIKLGLTAYVPKAVVNSSGMAYAIVLHGIQTLWYIAAGLLALPALSRSGAHVSLSEAVRESSHAADAEAGGTAQGQA